MRQTEEQREAGYAAVDAVMALAILATTVTLCLSATSTAGRAAAAAEELAAARTTLRYVLDGPARAPGDYSGQTAAFSWTLHVVEVSPPDALPRLCGQAASAESRTTGKRYAFENQRFCPAPATAP